MTINGVQMPKQCKSDVAYAITKAGLSAIPIIGSPAAELFHLLIQPPLEKRRIEWMSSVGEKLIELETKGFKLEDLQSDQQFVSAVMHASQVALRTHQEGKLDALRNAIVNIAQGQAPEDTLQHIFLDLVDSFTELHLRILKIFQKPLSPPNILMGNLSLVLEHIIPELRGHDELYDQIWKDLYSRGLVNTDGLNGIMSVHGLTQKRTSSLGDSFIRFIEKRNS